MPPYPDRVSAVPVLLAPRSWGYHLVVVVALVAAGWLGLWQYHGWQDRRAAEARDLTQAAPIPLAEAIGPDDPFPGQYVGQPVEVVGQWEPGSTVYVSGREHDGQDGSWVVTHVRVGDSLLPVVRGWTARSPQDLAAQRGGDPSGPVDLVGWLQPSEADAAADDDPADDVLPQLRVADLAQRFDDDLYGAYVVVRDDGPDAFTDDGGDGLVRADLQQPPDAGRFTAIRNLLYAFEWWFFGAFAAFVWWRWAREEVALDRAGREAGEDLEVVAGEATTTSG